jgi:hypothetical protein
MGYGADYTAIWDALITAVQGCSSFSSTNTSGAYIKDWTGVTYPIAMIRPRRDQRVSTEIGAGIEERVGVFRIEIRNLGTGTQDDQDTIISLVGEIKDAIDADPTLGGVANVNATAEDSEIDFSLRPRGNAVVYYAIMLIKIVYIRVLG